MGSDKYEGESTFDSFVSKHGGHSNASTDYEMVYWDAVIEGCSLFLKLFWEPCSPTRVV